ncbi:transcriptional regulator GlxA family with amidase domain [Chitinophaga niastensis]|uniref:Transcriptional regulator GlxA family with amidase domain n=1 Tax=Chitinophaga niastensis TaxID=536980 RepID=A0A2P8HEZ2_CHINA|nr:helix-turn-helix domain-containing protein [Chitinophaga niastensis]PSL44761.1 transcriptional regulator GlxA family with amidase domain [Chitinophaga niastensis]
MLQIGILLPRQYKLLSLAAILDVFETVNKIYNQKDQLAPFEITLLYATKTTSAMEDALFGYPTKSISDNAALNLILVPSFTTDNLREAVEENHEYLPWLNQQYHTGAEIASFCTGAFLLGASGLLDGKIATTHVDACKEFAAAFPAVNLCPDKTVTRDGRMYTSGGATSTFHLLLHLLEIHCGIAIAVRAAKIFAIDMGRDKQAYFSTFQPSRNHHDDLVATAQQKIETSYHDTGTIEEMIKDIPSSRRNIVRRFKLVTGITPIEYLQQTRIEAAKKLLEQTGQQMNEIIFHSGYNDPKAFRKIFRKTVGMTPSEYREKFNVIK